MSNPLVFEFAKYTEVTELALSLNPGYKENGFFRIFLCPDVRDFWLVRLYETSEGMILLERDKIAMDFKAQRLTLSKAKDILKSDEFEVWDSIEFDSLEEAIDSVDGSFGINNLKEQFSIMPDIYQRRWKNAISIVTMIKDYCNENSCGFIVEDEPHIFEGKDLEVSDTSIILRLSDTYTVDLFINDKELDEGLFDSTEEWLERTCLNRITFVKMVKGDSLFHVENDELILRK